MPWTWGATDRLLDVGGDSGAFDIELCRLYPRMTATVYDLPLVAHIAAEKVEEQALRSGSRRWLATSYMRWLHDVGYQDVRTVSFEAPGGERCRGRDKAVVR